MSICICYHQLFQPLAWCSQLIAYKIWFFSNFPLFSWSREGKEPQPFPSVLLLKFYQPLGTLSYTKHIFSSLPTNLPHQCMTSKKYAHICSISQAIRKRTSILSKYDPRGFGCFQSSSLICFWTIYNIYRPSNFSQIWTVLLTLNFSHPNTIQKNLF